jgi:putative hydrolase of the HAD superfamily
MMQQFLWRQLVLNIVLDLDDTLYLERDYVRSGLKAVDRAIWKRYQKEGFFELAWALYETGERGHLIDAALTALNLSEAELPHLLECYRQHKPDITLLPDAKAFLEQHSQRILALITDGRAEGQWQKIKALELAPFFSKIIVTGERGPAFYKPNPWAFKEVMQEREGLFIYIGDNPQKDFIAPQQLGWLPSIRIRRPGSMHEMLVTPSGVREIDSFDRLKIDRDTIFALSHAD